MAAQAANYTEIPGYPFAGPRPVFESDDVLYFAHLDQVAGYPTVDEYLSDREARSAPATIQQAADFLRRCVRSQSGPLTGLGITTEECRLIIAFTELLPQSAAKLTIDNEGRLSLGPRMKSLTKGNLVLRVWAPRN